MIINESESLIKQTKTRFALFTLLGIFLVSVTSITGLKFHEESVKNQKLGQDIFVKISSQLTLVNQIAVIGEMIEASFVEGTKSNFKVEELRDDFSALVKELSRESESFRSWFENKDLSAVHSLEEVIEDENILKSINEYVSHAQKVVDSKIDTVEELRSNIEFMTRKARFGIGEAFRSVTRKVSKQQRKSLAQLDRVGFILVGLCILQVILVWLLVFRPLYSTIMIQHEKVTEALLSAESANRSKTDFLANISHEIRTPMTGILGYAELVKNKESTTEELEEAVRIINSNASHLMGLIDEILDISKMESGKFDYDIEEVEVSPFLNDFYSLINVQAENKGIELRLKNEGAIPSNICSDRKRFKQILFNIVGNAIKFTERGYVEVIVSYQERLNKLVLKVIDTGPGIAKKSREALFKPFQQADTSVSREHGGTGLGLVLSRGLARGLGGDIKIASSEPGKGSTFEIRVDCGSPDDSRLLSHFSTNIVQVDDESTVNNSKPLELKNILVVDDAKENARLFKIYLEGAGANVILAHDGQQAIDQTFATENLDLIFMDLQMPRVDGFQALKAIKEKRDIPILALTAHAMKEEFEKTKKAGFDGHITKPVSAKDLIQAARNFS